MKALIRKLLHRLGYELYRYPDACERLMPHVQVLLSRQRIDGVIDVGANEGQFAAAIRALVRDVYIHSIEPNPAAYDVLVHHARNDAKWTTHACALGRSSGRITLSVSANSAFSSCLTANAFGQQQFAPELAVARTIDVDLRTLDQLAQSLPATQIGQRLLLKLDTQGFDLEVLHGAESVLARAQIVVTEASLRPIYAHAAPFAEILAFMTARGFVLTGFFPVSRDAERAVIEADCVFLRATERA